jgi:hypothetical protein
MPMLHPSISVSVSTLAANLMSRALSDFPPKAPMLLVREALSHDMRHLGNYLMALGYVTAEQLDAALADQHLRAEQGQHRALGEILVSHQIISTQVLTAVLMVQMIDRLNGWDDMSMQFIGEQLVATGRITPHDLAAALQLQMWLRQRDVHVRLGDLLIQQGALDERSLAAVLGQHIKAV